jgi:hypothetical protein
MTVIRLTAETEVKIKLKLKQNPSPRAHFVLFAHNTPFRPKTVTVKNKFQRNPKHRNQGENDE